MARERDKSIVRGIDFDAQGTFNAIGQMRRCFGYREFEFDTFEEASKFVDGASVFDRMFPINVHQGFTHKYVKYAPGAEARVFDVIDLKLRIDLAADDLDYAKIDADEIEPTIFTWAEKSRLPGARGWRVSAMNKGRLDWDDKNEGYVLRKRVTLGGANFYDRHTVAVGQVFSPEGIQKEAEILREGLERFNPLTVKRVVLTNKTEGKFEA